MPAYQYRAVGPSGIESGQIVARSVQELTAHLEARGLMPLSIRERKDLLRSFLRRKPSPVQIADTVRNLADLLATGGVPLLQALTSIQQEEASPAVREVVSRLRDAVEQGQSLASAMASMPDVFPEVVVRIVEVSEARGDLDRALNEAARFLERDVSTRSRIRAAMAYPGFVLFVAVSVVVFMSVGVMPKLAGMFATSGIPLPFVTRILLAGGTALARFWYIAVAAAAGSVFAVRWALRQEPVRSRMDLLLWKAPVLRVFTRNFAYSRWATTIGLMHSSGVPLLETLRLARGVAGNAVMTAALGPVEDRVRDGVSLSAALRECGVFPPTIIQMVALGEEHGTLGEMLQRTGRRYEIQTERLLEKLPQFIEPAFIVVIGAVVGIMLLAFYWPLVNIYQIAAKGG